MNPVMSFIAEIMQPFKYHALKSDICSEIIVIKNIITLSASQFEVVVKRKLSSICTLTFIIKDFSVSFYFKNHNQCLIHKSIDCIVLYLVVEWKVSGGVVMLFLSKVRGTYGILRNVMTSLHLSAQACMLTKAPCCQAYSHGI